MENIETYPLTVAAIERCHYLTKLYAKGGYSRASADAAKVACIEEMRNAILLLNSTASGHVPVFNAPKKTMEAPKKTSEYDIFCPNCNNNNIKKDGMIPYNRKGQSYKRQRFKCKDCGRTFFQKN